MSNYRRGTFYGETPMSLFQEDFFNSVFISWTKRDEIKEYNILGHKNVTKFTSKFLRKISSCSR